MRVLMISKACLVGTYQRKLEELAQLVDLTVIVPPSWRDAQGELFLERAYTSGYRLVVDLIRFNGRYHLFYFPRLRSRIAQFQPDILHIDEEPYNFATWHALRAGRAAGAKSLFFSWQNLVRRYPFPFSAMEQYVMRHAEYAIVGSKGAESVWREKGYKGPISIIPQFGVDPDIFYPRGDSDAGKGYVIGYIGRLVEAKGLDLLIRAVSRLDGVWRLVIAGDGPERNSLEQLASSLNILDRVVFDGQLPSGHIPAYLRELDTLVLPSRTRPNWTEQFGRVLIEAMATGIPVIGSDTGEIPHVLGSGGLVFPEDDVDALYHHLNEIQRNLELRDQIGKAGRERVLNQFTQARIAEKTHDVYLEMTT